MIGLHKEILKLSLAELRELQGFIIDRIDEINQQPKVNLWRVGVGTSVYGWFSEGDFAKAVSFLNYLAEVECKGYKEDLLVQKVKRCESDAKELVINEHRVRFGEWIEMQRVQP